MIVRFKKGRFYPNFWTLIRQTFSFDCRKELEFTVKFTDKSRYFSNDQADWLKLGGWKSGTHTKTNIETLAVFRYVPNHDHFEVGEYRRDRSHFVVTSRQIVDVWDSAQISIDRRVKEIHPAFSWAGGDFTPDNDFEIDLKW